MFAMLREKHTKNVLYTRFDCLKGKHDRFTVFAYFTGKRAISPKVVVVVNPLSLSKLRF